MTFTAALGWLAAWTGDVTPVLLALPGPVVVAVILRWQHTDRRTQAADDAAGRPPTRSSPPATPADIPPWWIT